MKDEEKLIFKKEKEFKKKKGKLINRTIERQKVNNLKIKLAFTSLLCNLRKKILLQNYQNFTL